LEEEWLDCLDSVRDQAVHVLVSKERVD